MAKRILITDDALFMRVTLKNILTQSGYEVVGEATNGKEAVELYQSLKPDLVTMDITMPEMDGIQALKEIKALDPAAVIVMCTAMGQKNMVVEAVQSGAKDFIVKPFQPDRVVEAVGKLLAA
jgi:two-component system chemotaxis response regulator CheY